MLPASGSYRLDSRLILKEFGWLSGGANRTVGGISSASIAADRVVSLCLGFRCMCRGHADVLFAPFWHLWNGHHISPRLCHAEWKDRRGRQRSEEHTSELQSLRHLVCR